jgi:subtilisin family serine protease
MAKRSVIIQFGANKDLGAHAFESMMTPDAKLEPGALPKIAGVSYDTSAAAVPIPSLMPVSAEKLSKRSPRDTSEALELAMEPAQSTYAVAAEIDDAKYEDIAGHRQVVGVFSNPQIEPCQMSPDVAMMACPGSPPIGTHVDVANALGVAAMARCGMDGEGVLVAIVDSGINEAHINAKGVTFAKDVARSWVPASGMTAFNAPVGHGTMCAFDALIAAPKATLLDVQLLRSTATGPTAMSGVLFDAVRAYRHLINIMTAPRRPGEARSLVVNNSWGMFRPQWDFPVGHPGNYSNNPAHPFNVIVGSLDAAGADILFAAGNCGANCPDGRCQDPNTGTVYTSNAIYGANSHGSVLCVAGVDVNKVRAGYSSVGPGRLVREKPDLSGYTHFRGSGVYPADGGTSAATPVVTGVVAAVRSLRPYNPADAASFPAQIRNLMRSTCEDLGASGYDFEHGWGVVSGTNLRGRLCRPVVVRNICERYPQICRIDRLPDLCERFPDLCRPRIPVPPIPPIRDPFPPRPPFPPLPGPGPRPPGFAASADMAQMESILSALTDDELVDLAYYLGQLDAVRAAPAETAKPAPKSGGGCGCGGGQG